jgi:hypothetical protein
MWHAEPMLPPARAVLPTHPTMPTIGRLGSHREQTAVSDRTQPDTTGIGWERPLRVIPSERPVGETGVDGSKTAPLRPGMELAMRSRR